jgi:hypothetical protein
MKKRGEEEEEKCFEKKKCGLGNQLDHSTQLKANNKSEQFIWLSKKIETN